MIKTKLRALRAALLILISVAVSAALSSCDDNDNIGSSLGKGEVSIQIDSLYTITGRSVRAADTDSRAADLLLGRLYAEQYGELEASFAGQLLPAASLTIPDSIPEADIDGLSLRFTYQRTAFTGDTLAPQQLTVYRLTRQLPDTITGSFDPEGYYNPSQAMGSKTFTASMLGLSPKGTTKGMGTVTVPLGAQFARELVRQYRTDPSIFQWPQNFAQKFPGILVRSTFGRGLVLAFSNTQFLTYYHRTMKVHKIINGVSTPVDTVITDSATMLTISPEVLSANMLRYTPAPSLLQRIQNGEAIVASPAGYNVEIEFPARQILERYKNDSFNMAVINTLTFSLPAKAVPNSYGITTPPHLLMIKSDKMEKFFDGNNVPGTNDPDVFWAKYNEKTGSYDFTGLRPYIVNLQQRGGELTDADVMFTLVPVEITTESTGSAYNPGTAVTRCAPYIAHPTMAILDLAAAKIKFTYSTQIIK